MNDIVFFEAENIIQWFEDIQELRIYTAEEVYKYLFRD